jgi:hypothetical protein
MPEYVVYETAVPSKRGRGRPRKMTADEYEDERRQVLERLGPDHSGADLQRALGFRERSFYRYEAARRRPAST